MTGTTFEDMFRKDMDAFMKEFRDRLATSIRNGGDIESWKNIRNNLLFDYPRLRQCYTKHGIEHELPIEKQSEEAKLGRWLAGAMHSVRDDMYDVRPIKHQSTTTFHASKEDLACSEVRGLKMAAAVHNWIRQTAVTSTVQRPERHVSEHPLLEELVVLKPGEEMGFFYRSKKLAMKDQSSVAYFAKMLGWYKTVPDGRRPYSTNIKDESDDGNPNQEKLFRLTVRRLDTSIALPIVMKRG
jgi:hypothetical protein